MFLPRVRRPTLPRRSDSLTSKENANAPQERVGVKTSFRSAGFARSRSVGPRVLVLTPAQAAELDSGLDGIRWKALTKKAVQTVPKPLGKLAPQVKA